MGRAHDRPSPPDLDALLALIELRLAFMPAVALAKEQLGLPTEDATQEAEVVGARASGRPRSACRPIESPPSSKR